MMNYYQILEIPESANLYEIKSAYKRLAMQFHPDRNPGDGEAEERFKQVNNAYQVLSDLQSRTQYDIQISFQQYQQTATYTDSTNSYSSSYRNGRYRNPYHKEQNGNNGNTYEERRKAEKQDFAVAILLIVSMLAIIGLYIGVTSYVNMRKADEERAFKEAQLAKARMYLQGENYAACLVEVNSLLESWPTEKEYIDFQDNILNQVRRKADEGYKEGKYFESLQFYKLLLENENIIDKDLKFRVAECYTNQKRYNNAIAVLKEIGRDSPNNINAFYYIAENYLLQNRVEDALTYLEHAQQMAIRYYENQYGEAYAIVLDRSTLPNVHFDIFYMSAQLHYEKGDYEQAAKDCTWAIFLRPETPEALYLKGNSEQGLNKTDEACKNWEKAQSMGFELATQQLLKFCEE